MKLSKNRMKQTILSTILFFSASVALLAQSDLVFDDTTLPEIHISIDQSYLDQILEPGNEDSEEEFSADFLFASDNYEATELNVGFRLRGNTSRDSEKKSFKIAFNAFEKGRDLEGLEKLNLNGEHNDPSIIRSKLCWDLMQKMGVHSPRANHVKLYINEAYKGLYINVEHIDEEFAEERFGDKTGNLYKCLYPADLNYKGENPDLYKEMGGGRRTYELTINEEEDDYSDLANFIKVLNRTPINELPTELEKVFDVNSYLKILAVEIMTGHWDNYGFNQNNYYLYHNPVDDKFYYIPYDMDNTFAVDFFGNPDFAEHDMYEWHDEDRNRPLTQRLMSLQRYRSLLSIYMEELLEYYDPEVLFPRIDALKAMIQTAAEADTYKSLDYGFTNEDFDLSYTAKPDYSFVRMGLKPFITTRYESTVSQLIITSTPSEKTYSLYPNPAQETLSISTPPGNHQLIITAMDGRVIDQFSFHGPLHEFPIPATVTSPGLYFISILSENGDKQTLKWLYAPQ